MKDNAVKFYEYMCEQGVPFSEVQKKIGSFSAVLFYLREYDKWLKTAKIQGEQ